MAFNPNSPCLHMNGYKHCQPDLLGKKPHQFYTLPVLQVIGPVNEVAEHQVPMTIFVLQEWTLLSYHVSSVPLTLRLPKGSIKLIGASVSEPHTSELNCGISLIYVSYVIRPLHAYARRVRTLCA